jgi:hypothetical protein
MQGHSDDEDATLTAEEFVDAVTDLPVPIVTPEIIPETSPTEQLMQISAEALHDIPGKSTLSVPVQIGK